MRISRKKRPDKPLILDYLRNEAITAPEVRLIDAEGNNLGVMSTRDAIQKAQELEMDLVEINPKANPPVAQIHQFSHFKYQKEKEARKQRNNSHVSDIKGIRLSIRIGEHDMNIRREQAKKFLERGDKVKAEIIMRGRENAKGELAYEVIREFFTGLDAMIPVRYEEEAKRAGNKVTAIIIRK